MLASDTVHVGGHLGGNFRGPQLRRWRVTRAVTTRLARARTPRTQGFPQQSQGALSQPRQRQPHYLVHNRPQILEFFRRVIARSRLVTRALSRLPAPLPARLLSLPLVLARRLCVPAPALPRQLRPSSLPAPCSANALMLLRRRRRRETGPALRAPLAHPLEHRGQTDPRRPPGAHAADPIPPKSRRDQAAAPVTIRMPLGRQAAAEPCALPLRPSPHRWQAGPPLAARPHTTRSGPSRRRRLGPPEPAVAAARAAT